jgi:hypothetical protein
VNEDQVKQLQINPEESKCPRDLEVCCEVKAQNLDSIKTNTPTTIAPTPSPVGKLTDLYYPTSKTKLYLPAGGSAKYKQSSYSLPNIDLTFYKPSAIGLAYNSPSDAAYYAPSKNVFKSQSSYPSSFPSTYYSPSSTFDSQEPFTSVVSSPTPSDSTYYTPSKNVFESQSSYPSSFSSTYYSPSSTFDSQEPFTSVVNSPPPSPSTYYSPSTIFDSPVVSSPSSSSTNYLIPNSHGSRNPVAYNSEAFRQYGNTNIRLENKVKHFLKGVGSLLKLPTVSVYAQF